MCKMGKPLSKQTEVSFVQCVQNMRLLLVSMQYILHITSYIMSMFFHLQHVFHMFDNVWSAINKHDCITFDVFMIFSHIFAVNIVRKYILENSCIAMFSKSYIISTFCQMIAQSVNVHNQCIFHTIFIAKIYVYFLVSLWFFFFIKTCIKCSLAMVMLCKLINVIFKCVLYS